MSTRKTPAIVTERRKAAKAASETLTKANTALREAEELAAHWAEQAERLSTADPNDDAAVAAYDDAVRRAQMASNRLPIAQREAAQADAAWRQANGEAVLAELATDPDITGQSEERAVVTALEGMEQIRATLAAELQRIRSVEAQAAARARAAGLPRTDARADDFGIDAGGSPIVATPTQVALPGKMARQHGPVSRQVREVLHGDYRVMVAAPFDPDMPVTITAADDDDEQVRDRSGGLRHYLKPAPPGERFDGQRLPGAVA